ncbi:MAG: VCBS repeat-containing protein [Phycisphaerales bacterium]|nr:MAG: VCBS repeat-containing protein [Phycisphaerales bacterium]
MKQATLIILALLTVTVTPRDAFGSLDLAPFEFVQADGVDIQVPGYAAPTYVDWDNDGRKDLVVGEGGFFRKPRIRVWLNDGTPSEPHFSDYFYIPTADGEDLTYIGTDCTCAALGLYPRLLYWDVDGRKDLLVGQLDGTVMLYLNEGSDSEPVFGGGTFLQVGEADSKMDIDVGDIASPEVVDWDNDGRRDLIVGANDGKIHLFINQGTDTAPDFLLETFAGNEESDLTMPADGANPAIGDFDGDGKKDLLIGDAPGELLFFSNIGTDAEPKFSDYSVLESGGVPIQLDTITGASPRARPFITDWTNDGRPDVLAGAGDGKVYIFQSVPEVTTLSLLTLGVVALLRKRKV